MKLRLIHLLLATAMMTVLLSCSDDESVDTPPVQNTPVEAFTFVKFDVTTGNPADIPIPNEILRNPVTGLLSLPQTGDPAVDALITQVNTLDGFSTVGPFRIPFTGKVVPESVNAQTVLLFDVVDLAAAAQGAQVNPARTIDLQVVDDESGENSVVFGFPVLPLQPGRPHLVVVTQGVLGADSNLPVESDLVTTVIKAETPLVDANGNSARPGTLDNATAQQLEPLRTVYQQIWALAEQVTGQERVFIPYSFLFNTQTLYDTLAEMRNRAQTFDHNPVVLNAAVGSAAVDTIFRLLGISFIPHDQIGALYTGTIDIPFYQGADPLNGPIQGRGADVLQRETRSIEYVVTTPEGPGPFPTIIYQHGITSIKETGFAMANAAAANGVAIIAIELVGHGPRTPDLANNFTGAPGPDGVPDPSGAYFVNLANLLMSRDNLRQSVSDLYNLTALITNGNTDFSGDGIPELAPVGLNFVGVSLGGMVGTTFVATEPNIVSAHLNVAGGRFPYLLRESDSFGPAINDGLAGFGLVQGSALYDLYFIFAQAIADDADPINYGQHLFSGLLAGGVGKPILIQEVIGDTVVPNSATRNLARAVGIPQVNAVEEIAGLEQVVAPHVGSGLFQFTGAGHGSLIDGNGPTAQMQLQQYTFLLTSLLGEPTVIDPNAQGKNVNQDLKGLSDLVKGMNMDIDVSKMRMFYRP